MNIDKEKCLKDLLKIIRVLLIIALGYILFVYYDTNINAHWAGSDKRIYLIIHIILIVIYSFIMIGFFNKKTNKKVILGSFILFIIISSVIPVRIRKVKIGEKSSIKLESGEEIVPFQPIPKYGEKIYNMYNLEVKNDFFNVKGENND